MNVHSCRRAFHAFRDAWRNFVREEELRAVYRRFADLTMIPEQTYIDNLKLIEPYQSSSGCVVECGVWRGGMVGGMASLLGPSRPYVLCDSFEGLPPAQDVDGVGALDWQRKADAPDYFDNCTAPRIYAEEAMRRAQAQDVTFLQGWFNQTVTNYRSPRPIDVLRLDGDWYESTMTCLLALFEQVRAGGLIIVDDYYVREGCTRAVHDFVSQKALNVKVRGLGKVCYFYKET